MECKCPERDKDMIWYGVHACRDGERIAPENLYLTRPTADLGEAVARIEAAVDECSSDRASECLTADSFFQDAQTGRAIYVRDIRALLDAVLSRSGG